jgi:hypothetical protein
VSSMEELIMGALQAGECLHEEVGPQVARCSCGRKCSSGQESFVVRSCRCFLHQQITECSRSRVSSFEVVSRTTNT